MEVKLQPTGGLVMIRTIAKPLAFLRQGMVALVMMALFGVITTQAIAADAYRLELRKEINAGELHIPVGKSQILLSPKTLKQLIVGNPKIADVRLLSGKEILILGKSPGTTNLALRDSKKNIVALMDVVVGYDLLAIKRKLHEMLPGEDRVEVRSANDTVILSGEASSAAAMSAAMSIASSYVPKKEKIVNHMQVGGGQQVMLEVTIAELARSVGREFGVDAEFTNGDVSIIRSAGLAAAGAGLLGITSSVIDIFNIDLEVLEDENLAKILAEPKIVALSGQEASFLAGGEFAVRVEGGDEGDSVEFKEFGVGVKFTPHVLHSKKISLKLNTEVSDIAADLGIEVEGAFTPGIKTRRASTTIELADGESFMIAGLLSNDLDNAIGRFPGLGDVPVLGALFTSSDFQRNETELVISITPRLVKPVPSGALAYPTDGLVPPSEVDQFLHGRLHGQATSGAGEAGGMDGPSGHQL